jgi:hypothetical protein
MGCGCSSCGSAQVARLVERMTVEDWGPDKTGLADDLGNQVTTGNGGEWLHITKPCGFVAIGPQSDWDVVVVEGPDLIGPTLVSVEHPLVAPLRAKHTIKPWRARGAQRFFEGELEDRTLFGRIDVVSYESAPAGWSPYRPPKLIDWAQAPELEEDPLGPGQLIKEVIVAGRATLNLYLDMEGMVSGSEWRLVGVKAQGTRLREFAISPTGYPVSNPTFNTIDSDTNEAWHYEIGIDHFDAVRLYARLPEGTIVNPEDPTTSARFQHAWELRDRWG